MDTDALPADLVRLGFKLITRAQGRMFAVSQSWGCTETLPDMKQVIRQARAIAGYLQRRTAANERRGKGRTE